MPSISPKHPAAELIRAAFKGAIARMQAADPEARRGEPEGVHRLRTATRRLRSELRAVAELVDQEWGEHLEQELKWLASELGSVRDLDILCQRLRAALPSVASNGRIFGKPLQDRDGRRTRPALPCLARPARGKLAEASRRPARQTLQRFDDSAWRTRLNLHVSRTRHRSRAGRYYLRWPRQPGVI